jgi:hypothetical protein
MRWRLFTILVSCVLALVTGELAMRWYCFAPRVYDPQFGFVGDPNRASRWMREGNGVSHFELHGVRSNGTLRVGQPVLVLGDSMTEALQVDDGDTYSAVLERKMAPRFCMLNAGVSGASLGRYIALAPAYRELFRPRWTIVQFDISDFRDSWIPSDSHFVRDVRTGRLVVVPVRTAGQGGALRLLIRRMRAESAFLQNSVLQLVALASEWSAWRPFRNGAAVTSRSATDLQLPPIEEELEQLEDAFQGRVTLLLLPHEGAYGQHQSREQLAFGEICARRKWSCPHAETAFSSLEKARQTAFGFPNSGYNQGHLNKLGHTTVADLLAVEFERLEQDGLH